MMGVMGRVYQLFDAHPKRQSALEDAVLSTQPDSVVFKVKYVRVTIGGFSELMHYKYLSISMWLTWEEFVIMVQGYGPLTHSLMLGVSCWPLQLLILSVL